MKKRLRVLTAILLSAAMTLTPMSVGFADELTTVTEEGQKEEGQADGGQALTQEDGEAVSVPADDVSEADGEASTDTSGEESPENNEKAEGSASEGVTNEDAEDQSEVTGDQEAAEEETQASENGAETDCNESDEVSVNVVTGSEEGDGELADTSSSTSLVTTWEYSHGYDGNDYNPGTFKVPQGALLMSSPTYNERKIVPNGNATDGEKTINLKPIKTVSQSYYYYLYPQKTGVTDPECIQKVHVFVNPRPVTYRSGTYTKEYDGKPLSQNSAADAVLPSLVDGSLVAGDSFNFEFDKNSVNYGDPSKDTSVLNKFTLSANNGTELENYDPTYEYGSLIVTASRNNVNSLPTPQKPNATVDKKGGVKITWKKVKSYKENGKKGGKTTYDVYRYSDDGLWGEPIATGLKKASYTDKTPRAGERFIYKIVAVGYDSSGKYGVSETPAYARAVPKIVSLSPYDGIKAVNVTFMGLGTENDEYILEHWNVKRKGSKDQITVNKYNSTSSKFEGKTRTISTNTYTDTGSSNVQISVNKASFSFRVKAKETTVYDYGKKIVIPETKWSATQKVKMVSVAPVLKGERKSNNSFELKWNKVKKANGYLLEWSKNPDFANIDGNVHSIYVSKTEKTGIYNERKYTVQDVGFGELWYCRVTAYNRKNGMGGYGTAIGTSSVIVQYGRQEAVKNLKAEYYEDGTKQSDAKLTWEDEADNVRGYYIQRWSYEYNPATKEYDKETGHEVLREYVSKNDAKKYTKDDENKIKNGELIKYRVQSVVYTGSLAGEYHDGYVFSEPADYYYMNPTEIVFAKKKYTVAKGGTLTPVIKFKPKKMPKKPDGLTNAEFKKIFCFNDNLEYSLESDSLTNSEIKNYVTVGTSTGKLTGVKTYKYSYIKLRAKSPNDPSEVYALTTVCVGGAAAESDSSGSKEKSTTELTVCIDPGHGGKDDGATGNGITESKKNLEIALKVGKYLEKKGAKVYYTRKNDSYVSLTDRTDYADEKDCNLFVSIHCNSSENAGSNGTEVYYSVKSKYARPSLAGHISSDVSSKLGTKNLKAKTRAGNDGDYYSVIRTSAAKGIPGLIVEHAFLSNGSDASKLKDGSRIDDMAKAEADAIYKYWKE